MSDRYDSARIGEFVFTDSAGLPRYAGRTCNVYGSADDAQAAGSYLLRRGGRCYVFRTVDGLFDFSALPEPKVPELRGAELVATFG